MGSSEKLARIMTVDSNCPTNPDSADCTQISWSQQQELSWYLGSTRVPQPYNEIFLGRVPMQQHTPGCQQHLGQLGALTSCHGRNSLRGFRVHGEVTPPEDIQALATSSTFSYLEAQASVGSGAQLCGCFASVGRVSVGNSPLRTCTIPFARTSPQQPAPPARRLQHWPRLRCEVHIPPSSA